ncbi:hypothetical protein ACJX0J_036487, partial [Zea mays]
YGAEKELGANGHNLDRCDSVQEDEVSMAYMFVHMFGITLFGMAYMFVHDGLVHRCFPVGPIANVPYFRRVAAAHKGDNDYLDMVFTQVSLEGEEAGRGGGGKDALFVELWKACAGLLSCVPPLGQKVYYLPQGHIEQASLVYIV